MRDRLRRVTALVRGWFQPHRRAAVTALMKASILLASVWECVWVWHTKYYSRRYPEMPLSLAWAMLTVIAGIVFAQVGCSAILKLRGARLRLLSAAAQARLTALLADYISTGTSEEELKRCAKAAPKDFEACLTAALLGTRGFALARLRELHGVTGLRDKWIARSRRGTIDQRRYAVEHLGLLGDPAAIMALEVALEDSNAGIVAAAIRGLLRMPGYSGREELIESLASRSYLVRVLIACEPEAEQIARPAEVWTAPKLLVASEAGTRSAGLHDLQMRVAARPLLHRLPVTADTERAHCSALAGWGANGRDLLRLLSATGLAGEAPAEALGEAMAALARGGRS
jgi:hypothetical protein